MWLGERFEAWAGERVSRALILSPGEAMNRSLTILFLGRDGPGQLYSLPPLASIRFLDPRHLVFVGNISVAAEGYEAGATNGTAYILLSSREIALPHPVRGDARKISIRVWVNGFEAAKTSLNLRPGGSLVLPLTLNKLQIQALYPNGSRARDARLEINGRTFSIEEGSAVYLLPPGRYSVKVRAGIYKAEAEIELSGDRALHLTLSREPTPSDWLKVAAAAETLILAALIAAEVRRKGFLERRRRLWAKVV